MFSAIDMGGKSTQDTKYHDGEFVLALALSTGRAALGLDSRGRLSLHELFLHKLVLDKQWTGEDALPPRAFFREHHIIAVGGAGSSGLPAFASGTRI
ncbi:MAG: hypothetical protein ABSG07_02265, partial [Terriglobales bacterium]